MGPVTFARPELLWLALALPALLTAGVWAFARRRRRAARALGESALVRRLGGGDLEPTPVRRIVLLGLAAAALGTAAAGPRWGAQRVESRTRALNIVLAVDVSKSMLARDVEPSRLARERTAVRRLLRELEGDRIGLVVFAGNAYAVSPLTVDRSALRLYVSALDPAVVSQGGSSLSSAIRQATDLVRGDGTSRRGRAVILLTDGEAHEPASAVMAAARRAAEAGVVVHTVGIGTPEGAPVPVRDPDTGEITGYKRRAGGEVVVSRLDEELLRRIAERTGGRYVRLGSARAIDRLLAALESMERAPVRPGSRTVRRARFEWFLAFALLLLAIDSVWNRRDERKATSHA